MWYIVVDCERMLRVKERERERGNGAEREREREWREERESNFL